MQLIQTNGRRDHGEDTELLPLGGLSHAWNPRSHYFTASLLRAGMLLRAPASVITLPRP